MVRTAAFSTLLGVLFAWNWGRLEEPRPSLASLGLMIALGVLLAFVPGRRRRLVVVPVALLGAACFALEVYRPWALGSLAGRAGRGFLDFYDVLVPFDGSVHPLMRGVLLLAVFAFTALGSLAVAARRSLAASLVLAAGVGWPATIMPGTNDLARGAVVLAVVLALVAWLRPEPRRTQPQVLVGAAVVLAAVALSSSGAVAKAQFINWQSWNLTGTSGNGVDVSYVWESDYTGLHFPRKRTQVLTVAASSRAVYWRATTLDAFVNDLWQEELLQMFPVTIRGNESQDRLVDDPLLPAAAQNPDRWTKAVIHVDGLRDAHVVSPTGPIAYDSSALQNVQYYEGGVAEAARPLSRGTEYSAWGYEPEPTPSQLAKSTPDYSGRLDKDLEVAPGRLVPAFGSPGRQKWLAFAFADPRLAPYRPLYRVAEHIAGDATNPYAAAVALEAWFRSGGGFTYNETPRQAFGVPPLVGFVTKTKQGYCQHFAGAMALMLRYLGIPARVAAGFTSGSYDSTRHEWRVYDRNAHTWVEVWFKGYGWLPFDPTPGRGNLGGPYTSSSLSFDAPGAKKILAASALAAGKLLRFELGHPGKAGRGDARASSGDIRKGRGGGGPGKSVSIGSIALGVVGGLLLLLVAGKLVLRRKRFFTRDPRMLATACRRDLVDYLVDLGIALPQNCSLGELGFVVRDRIGVDVRGFVQSVGLARFGPPTAAPAAAHEARMELRSVHKRLRRVLPFGRRVRGVFSLRSLIADA